jgi:hypothetical protein
MGRLRGFDAVEQGGRPPNLRKFVFLCRGDCEH